MSLASGALAAPANDVKALIEKGNSAAAYVLGKQNPQELGNPVFDFYFGVAAVERPCRRRCSGTGALGHQLSREPAGAA